MEFTHAKQPYRATCIQFNGNNKNEFIDFLEANGAMCDRELWKGCIVVRWSNNPHCDSIMGIPIGGWARKGENGVMKCYASDELFQARGYKNISDGWILTSEELPELGVEVAVYLDGFQAVDTLCSDGKGQYWLNSGPNEVTYWREKYPDPGYKQLTILSRW